MLHHQLLCLVYIQGYYCNGSASEPDPDYGLCPEGYYCIEGSATPEPCPSGTFSNTSGNVELNDCRACTPGRYCAGNALTAPTDDCDRGYYCPAGQDTAAPEEFNCTIGHFCVRGSPDPTPCPSGEYQDEVGSWACKDCSPGYYCDANEAATYYGVASHGVVMPTICPEGSYCPSRTEYATEYLCPYGYYSNRTQLDSEDDCQACPGGTFCDDLGEHLIFIITNWASPWRP
ncbi:cysteine repeat modular protein A-like [Diadema setosum]|uniref:cysteine repeat modular protein A-like n=1 Tax=Diadema setosum TaxID=31175 RepID=UPI003B3A726F